MVFGGEQDDDDEVMSEINMTPLVDVMLVLLIIFIITIPVLTHAVKLNLPRAAANIDEVKPDRITLTVSANGIVHWNGIALDDNSLRIRLDQAAARQPQPDIYIRGDRKVDYEHVIRVMAAAQRAGILKLGFVTEPDSK